MIVKDEEALLPSCLKSVRDTVDEIVIVDTGSTDRSMEIARTFGAHVFEHPWTDDFAKHRNQSIAHATGKWILVLDADEQIMAPTGELIQEAVRDPEADSIAVQVVNPYNHGKNTAVFNSVRLFKNNGRIRYEGTVHNKEVGCRNTVFYPIQILHHGYNLDTDKMRQKFERTTGLLKNRIKHNPKDPEAHYYLAVSYLSAAETNPNYLKKAVCEALAAIRLAHDISPDDPVFLGAHYTAGAALLNMGELEQAQKICQRALSAYPDHLDSCYLLAKIQDQKGDFEAAEKYALRYFKIRDDIDKTPAVFGKVIHNSFWATSPMSIIIGKAAYEKGALAKAKQCFDKAVCQDSNGAAHKAVGQFFVSKEAFQEAEPYLKTASRKWPDKITLYMLAECYGRRKKVSDQIVALEALLDQFPEELERIETIGKVQFDRSNYTLSAWCLEQALKKNANNKDLKSALRIAKDWIREERRRGKRKAGRFKNSDPQISACLMVKNEESFLATCLESVSGFADEIIVVDTGSTDGTIRIAEDFGARVYHHPWQADFSLHRNQSMSYASGDWMLIIDADETLDGDSGPKVRQMIRQANGNAILFKVFNYGQDGQVISMAYSPRLFRNHVGCHYKDIVHNQPCFPGRPEQSDLCIHHWGYGLTEEKMASKRRRTRALLEKQIRQNPHTPFPRYNLTVVEFMAGNFERVVDEGCAVIQLLKENEIRDPVYANAYYYVAAAYNNLRSLKEAERCALDGLRAYPANLDLFFVLTVVALQKGDYAATIKYGEQYLSVYEKVLESPAQGNQEYKTIGNQRIVKLNLSRAYHELGKKEASSDYLTQVRREGPPTAPADIADLQVCRRSQC